MKAKPQMFTCRCPFILMPKGIQDAAFVQERTRETRCLLTAPSSTSSQLVSDQSETLSTGVPVFTSKPVSPRPEEGLYPPATGFALRPAPSSIAISLAPLTSPRSSTAVNLPSTFGPIFPSPVRGRGEGTSPAVVLCSSRALQGVGVLPPRKAMPPVDLLPSRRKDTPSARAGVGELTVGPCRR